MIEPFQPEIELVDRLRSVFFVASMLLITFFIIYLAREKGDPQIDWISESHIHFLIHLLQLVLFAIVAFRCSSLSGITGY